MHSYDLALDSLCSWGPMSDSISIRFSIHQIYAPNEDLATHVLLKIKGGWVGGQAGGCAEGGRLAGWLAGWLVVGGLCR